VEFFEQMKRELGMDNPSVWSKMITRPWPLNFDNATKFAFEEQMDEVVWAAARRAFVVGATSQLAIGNEH
jgi:hypothetical protein